MSDQQPESLSLEELRALHQIELFWVGDDYWADPTIQKFWTYGLVQLIGTRIVLTDKGLQIAKQLS